MTTLRLSTFERLVILAGVYLIAHVGLLERLGAPTFGWRPTDLAGIAVNYYRNGFHFAFPQVLWGGAGAGHVEMEFPLQSFLTALFFKLFGMHDWLCEVLPLVFGFGLVVTVAEFGRYLIGDEAALAAGVCTALSPTLVYITSNGMWADPPMVFFGTLGLYLLTRWSAKGSRRELCAAVACLSLAVLLKLTALYLGLAVVYLFSRRFGRGFLKEPTTWLAGLAILTPAALWYSHAYRLYLEEGNTFGIIGGGFLKFPTMALLTDLYIYKHTLVRVFFYYLTPVGSVLFLVGFYVALKSRCWLLLVWLACVVVHSFVVWGGIRYSGHIGYLLPILPICYLVIGLGFQSGVRAIQQWIGAGRQPRFYVPLLIFMFVLVSANTVVASRRFKDRDLAFETALWEKKKLTGIKVGQVTPPGSLIIVVDHEMDTVDQKHSMTPPDVFFFGDRHGWYRSLAWLTVDSIEQLRAEGAEYLVVSLQSVQQFERDHAAIHAYLDQHFRKVTNEDGIIYALARK